MQYLKIKEEKIHPKKILKSEKIEVYNMKAQNIL